MSDELRRLHIVVSGRVQGVWFRGSMLQEAEHLGAAGWVKNLPDGRVEAVVEGPATVLSRMVEWCRHGPSGARVDDVATVEEEPEGLEGFDIAT